MSNFFLKRSLYSLSKSKHSSSPQFGAKYVSYWNVEVLFQLDLVPSLGKFGLSPPQKPKPKEEH